ncbi:hypothetical protein [Flavobacterium sp.]|jgi:hypothetical protein|uniref:hypothetical protein n=1 Tax=Flavobacterium sp. TaxID=239 RepID=UPI0037BE2FD9
MVEHKHAEILRAIALGFPVQFRVLKSDSWTDVTALSAINPLNFPEYMYRLKPKQQPKTVVDRVFVEGISYNEFGEQKPYSKRMNITPRHIFPGDTLNIKVDVYI